jgi:hypothetical protein
MMEEKIANYSRYGLPSVFSGKISSFDKLNVHPESHTARATGLTELQVLRYGLDVIVSKIRGPYKGILLPRCEADHRESHPGEGVQAHHRRPDNRSEEVTLK